MNIIRALLCLPLLIICSCAGSNSDSRSVRPSYDADELAANLTYPPQAIELGIEGTVQVLVDLDETGTIVKARVVKTLHPLLDKAAVEAVQKTLFTPAIQNGKPIPIKITLPVTFKLKA